MKFITIFLIAIFSFNVFPHGGEKHDDKTAYVPQVKNNATKLINQSYIKTIRPIFKKSCFDCHTSETNYPWYYKLPIAKQLIGHDVK